MPRDVYYQSSGNPIQEQNLPDEPIELQFTHKVSESKSYEAIKQNLQLMLLASGMMATGDWFARCFQARFPWNAIIAFVLARTWLALWRRVYDRQLHSVLIFLPLAIHFIVPSLALRSLIAAMLTAFVSREFSRHYIYIATCFPMERKTADEIRLRWETNSVFASLVTLPVFIPLMAPTFAKLALLGLVAVFVVLIISCNPIRVLQSVQPAFKSWFSYNPANSSTPGILQSPSGPLNDRVTLSFLFVSSLTLLAASLVPVSGLVLEPTFSSIATIPLAIVMIAIPIVLAVILIVMGSAPALSLNATTSHPKHADNWKEVTNSIQRSSNPVERESLFLGRLDLDGSPLLVPRTIFREHAHLLGDSGSGKTARGLLPLAEQLLADGMSSLLVIDLKGDSQEMLSTLQHCSTSSKDPIPLRYFTVRDDNATFAFNPFQLACWKSLNLFQRTDVLCAALGLIYGTDYGRGFYSSANANLLHITLKAFPDIGSFAELYDRLNFVVARHKAYGLTEDQADAGTHIQMVCMRLASFKALNLTPGFTPNSEVLTASIDPVNLFNRQEIQYFHLSSTLGPGSSPEIARLAVYMLLTSATLTKSRRQVYLMIDEFQRITAHNMDVILQIARSMNIGVILANQSMSDLRRDSLVHVVEANCRLRQWYAISSPEEQIALSKASGETIEVLSGESRTTTSRGLGDTTYSYSRSEQEFVAPRLTLNDIKDASDDPRKSIVLVTRGAGYCQYGGKPIVIESDFHISESEFKRRRDALWPATTNSTFTPRHWIPSSPKPAKPQRAKGPIVTEEVVGEEPGLFDLFLNEQRGKQS